MAKNVIVFSDKLSLLPPPQIIRELWLITYKGGDSKFSLMFLPRGFSDIFVQSPRGLTLVNKSLAL
jgi:hypothetical protein